MSNLRTASARWLVLPALGLLAGCGSYGKVRDGTTDQPIWPDVGAARPVVPESVRPDLGKLRSVQAGMTKTEVYERIGHPQYREGLAAVQEWNYVFLLPDAAGTEATCQYKVLYDNQMLAKQFYWHPEACAQRLNPEAPAPVATEAPKVVKTLDLSTDMLFAFNSANLRPEGVRALDERVVSALTDAQRLGGIRLVGHADRLGSDRYNLDLSRRRAEAVKAHLVAKGVPASSIDASGRGEAEPMIECSERARQALIACLAPNRRVRVEITVDK